MRTILVVLPNNLGDVIMALPVLQGLRMRHADTYISFLVEEGYEAGLVGCNYCDRIVPLPRKQIKRAATGPDWQEALGMLRLLLDQINKQPCDLVINLSQHPYLSFLATLVGAAEIRGRYFMREGNHAVDDLWSHYLYAIPFYRSGNALHATDVYRRIAGCHDTAYEPACIGVRAEEQAWGRAYLGMQGWSDETRLIILQPGAAYPSKRWPAEHFIALGKLLIDDGYRILITGAKAERPIAEAIAEALGNSAIVTAGVLSFRETIVLCTFVDSVVCGDTALMHAAAALGKRVIALFGPTNPVETGPYGSGHTVIAGACVNRPCFRTDCPTMECMRSIDPAFVYACLRGSADSPESGSVFTTKMAAGRWQLHPVYGCSNDYVDGPAAALTFDVCSADTSGGEHYRGKDVAAMSGAYAAMCVQMADALEEYLVHRSGDSLGRFESLRKHAASLTGITAFWNALCNIRLNSVPLLDPVTGIEGSIAACRLTGEQIMKAIA